MITLTKRQRDALTELVNTASHSAASSLSEMIGERVMIETPHIDLCPMAKLSDTLSRYAGDDIVTVRQGFSGPITGDAFIVLSRESAIQLAEHLVDHHMPVRRLDVSDQELLTEVGNILLSACLGRIGDLLCERIRFAVPQIHVTPLHMLTTPPTTNSYQPYYVLVASTSFHTSRDTVEGHLLIITDMASLRRLMEVVQRRERPAQIASKDP